MMMNRKAADVIKEIAQAAIHGDDFYTNITFPFFLECEISYLGHFKSDENAGRHWSLSVRLMGEDENELHEIAASEVDYYFHKHYEKIVDMVNELKKERKVIIGTFNRHKFSVEISN